MRRDKDFMPTKQTAKNTGKSAPKKPIKVDAKSHKASAKDTSKTAKSRLTSAKSADTKNGKDVAAKKSPAVTKPAAVVQPTGPVRPGFGGAPTRPAGPPGAQPAVAAPPPKAWTPKAPPKKIDVTRLGVKAEEYEDAAGPVTAVPALMKVPADQMRYPGDIVWDRKGGRLGKFVNDYGTNGRAMIVQPEGQRRGELWDASHVDILKRIIRPAQGYVPPSPEDEEILEDDSEEIEEDTL